MGLTVESGNDLRDPFEVSLRDSYEGNLFKSMILFTDTSPITALCNQGAGMVYEKLKKKVLIIYYNMLCYFNT